MDKENTMFARKSNVLLLALALGISNLACNLSQFTASSEDAVATQVAQTLMASIPQETEEPTVPRFTDTASEKGLTALYFLDGVLQVFDMGDMSTHPLIPIPAQGATRNLTLNPDGRHLAYGDKIGLHCYDIEATEEKFFLASVESTEEFEKFTPRAWIDQDRLFVERWWGVGNKEPGWISISDGAWHPLPHSEETYSHGYTCHTGVTLAPEGDRIAITVLGHGIGCAGMKPALTTINLEDGSARQIVSREIHFENVDGSQLTIIASGYDPTWSSDGEWIAFNMEENAITLPDGLLEIPTRLYLVRPDGNDLNPISANALGTVSGPRWGNDGDLFYALHGDLSLANGLYRYNLTDRSHTLLVEGDAYPVSVSPNGEILLFNQEGLKALSLASHQVMNFPSGESGALAQFVGWLSSD
jgi:hypothetical protein